VWQFDPDQGYVRYDVQPFREQYAWFVLTLDTDPRTLYMSALQSKLGTSVIFDAEGVVTKLHLNGARYEAGMPIGGEEGWGPEGFPKISRLPSLAPLTGLTTVDTRFNYLTGTLPDWSQNTALREIWMSYNKHTGTIPSVCLGGCLGGLLSLRVLRLESNSLTDAAALKADGDNYPNGCSVNVDSQGAR